MGKIYANKEELMGGTEMKGTEKFENFKCEYQLENRCWRMYVKPYSKAVVEDLERLKNSAYAVDRVQIVERAGTYEITSKHPIENMGDYMETLWGILHRMYDRKSMELAYAEVISNTGYKQALKWYENDLGLPVTEEDRDKNFYILKISPVFIDANTLPRFQKAS